MKIKDIVNRDLVNLENCESEPIHIPGSIQPHGFLIAVKQSNFHIDFCTGNCYDFLGIAHTALLTKPFEAVFGAEEGEKLKAYAATIGTDASKPHVVTYNNIQYNTLIHPSGENFILDLEPFPDGSLTLPELYSQTKRFVSYLERSVTLQDLCGIIAEETRVITGYDRVMIYRFDKDYNGEVFAESRRDDLEPFFGLYYPHTDIPVQARQLYMRNLMRIIVDVNYTPAPIYTIDDAENKNLDLGDSVLRSVSPIHVEYLHNIGVGATLTISLMHNKRLWGLIACHHYSPKNLPHFTRLAAQLQGNFLTSQINVREVAEAFDASQLINKSLEPLLHSVSDAPSGNFKGLIHPHLLNITNSAGAVFLSEGILHAIGQVPSEEHIRQLVKWLAVNYETSFYASSKLIDDYPAADTISETASGILFHALGNPENDCLIWFRPEVRKTVNWAGDPNKAIIKNEKGLSPRKSFELWKEITKYQSEVWQEIELNAASKFAHALQKQLYLLYLTKEENKYRLLSEKLQKANSELENINWISNHDLKEPIRKIQVFASKILEDESAGLSEFTLASIQRMSDSAGRMQTLLNDLMTYSQLRDTSDAFSMIDLRLVIDEVARELKDEILEKQATLKFSKLPIVNGIAFQIHQLFLNLVQNALKFSKEQGPSVISLSFEKEMAPASVAGLAPGKDYYKVILKDNGVGFNNDYSHTIFNVFKRLHSAKKYKGTGIGLAICKKIMENHNGAISASSEIGVGSSFNLYFPVN
jgi:chemotaxis family two-component system sensor kinase Cph1